MRYFHQLSNRELVHRYKKFTEMGSLLSHSSNIVVPLECNIMLIRDWEMEKQLFMERDVDFAIILPSNPFFIKRSEAYVASISNA